MVIVFPSFAPLQREHLLCPTILPAQTRKSGGGAGKKYGFHQTFKNKGALFAAGADMSNEELLALHLPSGEEGTAGSDQLSSATLYQVTGLVSQP